MIAGGTVNVMNGLLVRAALAASVFCSFALSACGSDSGRGLLQVDVLGDQTFDHVTLRISTDDSVQRVFPDATFDSAVAYRVGIYVSPPGDGGVVRLTATVDNGSCVLGRGAIDVQGVMSGQTQIPVTLRVAHTPTCEPLPDGGATGAGGAGGARGTGTGGAGTGGNALNDPDLVLWYPFDEASGTVAADVSGFAGGPRNGQLMIAGTGSAVFSTTHMVGTHALDLTGGTSANGGYIVLPSLLALAPDAMTITVWVYVKTAVMFQKVFSFGTSATIYMSLTTNSSRPAGTEFEITMSGDTGTAQIIGGTAVQAPGTWHHLAVVLPSGASYNGSLYIDGALVHTTSMSLRPSNLGDTTQNYLGRSAITTTGYASMMLDDFRVYRRALSAAEIATVYGQR